MSNQASHEEYWQKRIDDIFRHVDRTDMDVFAELSKVYSEGAREAQRDLYEFLSKYSEGQGLTLSEASQRLFGEELSDYRQNAQRYREQAKKDPELLKRLNEQYASARATRLDALQMDLTARLGVMQGVLRSTLEDYFLKVAAHSYRKVMGGHNGAINAPALKELVLTPFDGKNFSNTLWGHVDNLAKDLKKSLTTGFIRGDHPRVMAQELAKKFKVANNRAETLVRTEGTAIVNRSVARRYQDAGLLYYRDLVHLDNRTTKICRDIAAKDERKLLSEMKPGINAAPYHFNCRTGIIPDEEELGGAGLAVDAEKVYNQSVEGMQRKKVIDQNKMSVASQEQINRLSRKFRRRGGEFIDDEDAIAYLDEKGAEAITLDAYTILKRKDISISALIEELEHAEQYLRGENDGTALSVAINEVNAKRKSIEERERYKLPKIEIDSVRRDIKYYQKEIERLQNENS